MMHPSELGHIFEQASKDNEQFSKIPDAPDVLYEDFDLIRHSHACFLPAARDCLRGRASADYRFKAARERRARLGGASRRLYHHQKQTFKGVIKLLSPLPVPETTMD